MSDKIPLSQKELEEHLEEQIKFLEISSESLDNGFDGEAKRLATVIRNLVHDTDQSVSLLKQLNKKKIKFLDSASIFIPENILAYEGLIFIRFGFQNAKRIAKLDEKPSDFKWVDFDTWWNMLVLRDREKRTLTRKEIILIAANQDGGAHIDSSLNEVYYNISKKNSLGWEKQIPTGVKQLEGGNSATIRQIAHELLKSLKPGYSKKYTPRNSEGQ